MRRRGSPPEAIRAFCAGVGVARRDNTIQLAQLEAAVREHLNESAARVMGVLDPIKLVIENYPEGESEELDAINNPQDPTAGSRKVPFSRELWIEREDFQEDPPKKFFRLAPGREVRLRYAYLVTCTAVVKNAEGEVAEVRCRYDPATRGGNAPDGRKVKGTIHWVSIPHALEAEVRLYQKLFDREDPTDVPVGEDFTASLNPHSLERRTARVEPSLASARPGDRFQFERLGYFSVDPDAMDANRVFNRIVTLRDSWAKVARKS
jgi:glutaminyl-tRNA synthetase